MAHQDDERGPDPAWLQVQRPRSDASVLLYAFGRAATGAAVWHAAADALPDHIELRAIRLAGREKRLLEPAPDTIAEQVASVLPAFAASVRTDERPYGVVGACSGALTAFEPCRALGRDGHRLPSLLISVDQAAPSRQPTSLRQQIVPNRLLGRTMTVAAVLAWSMVPVGALLGGAAAARVSDVAVVYVVAGLLGTAVGVAFLFSPLRNPVPVSTDAGPGAGG